MNSLTHRDRLRCALSYAERARLAALPHSADESTPHTRQAEVLLAEIRQDLFSVRQALSIQLQADLREQAGLSERLVKRKVTPDKANESNRLIAVRLERHRAHMAQLDVLLAAKTSAEAGGFVDLTLDRYAQILVKPQSVSVAPSPETGPVKANRIQWKPTRKGFIIWMILMAVALVGSLAYLGVFRWSAAISLEAARDPTQSNVVHIVCINRTRQPLTVCVPYLADVGERGGYGLRIEVREQDSSPFRAVANPVECWRYLNRPLQENASLTIAPGLPLALALDLNALQAPGLRPNALRIIVVTPSGRNIAAREISGLDNVTSKPTQKLLP